MKIRKKILFVLNLLIIFIISIFRILIVERKLSKLKNLLKSLLKATYHIINHFNNYNRNPWTKNLFPNDSIANFTIAQLEKLRETSRGLYKIQKMKSKFSYTYSLVIPVYKPKPIYFKILLESCINQSVDDIEILLGFDGEQSIELTEIINHLVKKHEFPTEKIKVFTFNRTESEKGISITTNKLVQKATGDFLIFIDHDDWIRPDLVYRYDLILRSKLDPLKCALYCDEYKIDEYNNRIFGTYLRKSDVVPFPYLFLNWVCHCLLVSRSAFTSVGGLRKECDGAQDYDLILRLDLIGIHFSRCPVSLYGWRVHELSTASNTGVKSYANNAGLKALTDYVHSKKLQWEIKDGYIDTTYLAFPRVTNISDDLIQVVIPFKDQESMTCKAIESLLRQKNIKLKVTLVNNQSSDKNINHKILNKFSNKIDIEIIDHDEPFNFSRICNSGAVKSRFHNTKNILFMNNDVELDENAVYEMHRWINEQNIAIVGCKLLYPEGQLQHGGVDLRDDVIELEVSWSHTNYKHRKGVAGIHDVQRVVDAVTGACLLIRRSIFTEVGGFDENLYPIAFSDTDLCARVNQKGYLIFYTPTAFGIHYESISREKNSIEDFESSSSLFESKGLKRPRMSFYYRNV